MFFYLSKILWSFAQPMSLMGLLLVVALVALILARRRVALAALGGALLILAVFGWMNTGAVMMQALESRFDRPSPEPDRVDGIIVLGGAFEGAINLGRGGFELNDAADRMIEATALALRYPQARVVVSGGSARLISERIGDASVATPFFQRLGVDPSRLVLEGESRNTEENAELARAMAQPKPGETWLLVTSASHMPRSVGLFRKAGWDVVAWPADYRSTGQEGLFLCRETVAICMRLSTAALREWIGLTAYWLTGRIDDWLPGPANAETAAAE